MPTTRRSMGSTALQPVDDNKVAPTTPGTKVRNLEAKLEEKDAKIAELSNALNALNLAKEKVDLQAVEEPKQVKKKDKDAPVPAKTAYKYFCEATPKQDDMRLAWKEAAPDVRQKFAKMADEDKARYVSELAAYEEQKTALEMFHEKKKQEAAMELYEAHLNAKAVAEKAEVDKKGKKKAKKDPEAPKRPTSSYMYFVMEKRDSVTKANPEASMTEITKILGEMWNKQKGKSVKKYENLAAKDKARYEQEKSDYEAMLAERKAQAEQEKEARLQQEKEEAMELLKSVKENQATMSVVANVDDMSVVSSLSNKPRKKKDPNAPKKATSAYLYFCTENRAAIKSNMPEKTTQSELLTEVGRQWKALPDAEKEKYIVMANKDKERYAQEMQQYKAEQP